MGVQICAWARGGTAMAAREAKARTRELRRSTAMGPEQSMRCLRVVCRLLPAPQPCRWRHDDSNSVKECPGEGRRDESRRGVPHSAEPARIDTPLACAETFHGSLDGLRRE